jgi:hypothetical protein
MKQDRVHVEIAFDDLYERMPKKLKDDLANWTAPVYEPVAAQLGEKKPWDVGGGALSVGRFLDGEEECFRVRRQSRGRVSVKVNAQTCVGFRAVKNFAEITKRYLDAAMGIVLFLKQQGQQVSIDMVMDTNTYYKNDRIKARYTITGIDYHTLTWMMNTPTKQEYGDLNNYLITFFDTNQFWSGHSSMQSVDMDEGSPLPVDYYIRPSCRGSEFTAPTAEEYQSKMMEWMKKNGANVDDVDALQIT